jgi:lipid A 4'-phosphatase
MNRTGLIITLVTALVTGLVFGLYPQLDIAVASLFYDPALKDFPARGNLKLIQLRDTLPWLIGLLVAPAIVAVILKLAFPRWRMLVRGRAAILLIATLIVGPGVIANVTLKDNWDRPRPINVTEFGGTQRFVPWWDPRGECEKNCSFVAGESAGAFWTLAPAALTPPQWRIVAYAAAITFGAAVGVLRMAFGGHFFSDVVFAGVLLFLTVWVTHGLLYRWRATRIGDDTVEHAIETVIVPIHTALGRAFTRVTTLWKRDPDKTPASKKARPDGRGE